MTGKNPKMDEYLRKAAAAAELRPRSVMLGNAKMIMKWHDCFEKLRVLALETGLNEEIKWGQPCYTLDDKNIVMISGAKDSCVLVFFKGVLLKDPKHLLIQQTQNVQAGRFLRFHSAQEIDDLTPTIKSYIKEAIDVEKAGLKVPHKETKDFEVVPEFQEKLDSDPALKRAFESLTPGRQRGYLYYFSQAKLSKTREERVKKFTPKILDGLGLDDEN